MNKFYDGSINAPLVPYATLLDKDGATICTADIIGTNALGLFVRVREDFGGKTFGPSDGSMVFIPAHRLPVISFDSYLEEDGEEDVKDCD